MRDLVLIGGIFHSDETRMSAADFVRSGFSYYLYDLAVTLRPLESRLRAWPNLIAAVREKSPKWYLSGRPLSEEHRWRLVVFEALRLAEVTDRVPSWNAPERKVWGHCCSRKRPIAWRIPEGG